MERRAKPRTQHRRQLQPQQRCPCAIKPARQRTGTAFFKQQLQRKFAPLRQQLQRRFARFRQPIIQLCKRAYAGQRKRCRHPWRAGSQQRAGQQLCRTQQRSFAFTQWQR